MPAQHSEVEVKKSTTREHSDNIRALQFFVACHVVLAHVKSAGLSSSRIEKRKGNERQSWRSSDLELIAILTFASEEIMYRNLFVPYP